MTKWIVATAVMFAVYRTLLFAADSFCTDSIRDVEFYTKSEKKHLLTVVFSAALCKVLFWACLVVSVVKILLEVFA